MAGRPHFLQPLLGRDTCTADYLLAVGGDAPLATTLELAIDSPARKRGLLGRDALPQGHALVIAPCAAVHTMGMRFPLDIVFASRDGRVVAIRHAVRPWRLAVGWRAFAAIELAAGAASRAALQVGDRVAVVRRRDARDASSR
jgi:uncharacterized membrane protein (UPF0127 family)